MIRSPRLRLTRALFAVVAAGLTAPLAHAQTKIATIDLRKVFDGYWKTKQADAQLKERQADLEKSLKTMLDDYQKANTEFKKMQEEAGDQAVSNDERDKRKAAAEKKLLEIKEIEQSITAFRRTSDETLRSQSRRARENILREVREFVDARAKGGGFTLVVDTSAESLNNQTSIFLYFTPENDLTTDVLKELNANAPVGAPKSDTSDKPGDSKDDKKQDK